MKERIRDLLIGLGLVAAGAVCFVISKDYNMSIGSFTLDYRIAGAFFGVLGLVICLLALLRKKKRVDQTPADLPPAEPADPRQQLQLLEEAMEADPGDPDLAREFLRCSDALLRQRGDKSFDHFQQRFCVARRAVYIEEKHCLASTDRRFRAIHSAVHGGLAAASSQDADVLEDALDMLTGAAQLKSEGAVNPELEQRYSETAVNAVTCWVCYRLSRIYADEKPNYRRSAELLKRAMTLCPREGIRGCDLNPRMADSTRVVLAPNHLNQLKRHLLSKVKPQ